MSAEPKANAVLGIVLVIAAASCFAMMGSSDVYTITLKPSFTSVFAAARVSTTLG